jgi:hypothetical protein
MYVIDSFFFAESKVCLSPKANQEAVLAFPNPGGLNCAIVRPGIEIKPIAAKKMILKFVDGFIIPFLNFYRCTHF